MPKDEFDFDDPMELSGVGLFTEEDTTDAMAECFIEEFLRMGYNHKQILALFRNPHYLGMKMVLQNRGEAFVRERIAEVFARWGKAIQWPVARAQAHKPASISEDVHCGADTTTPSEAASEWDLNLTDPMGAAVPKLKL